MKIIRENAVGVEMDERSLIATLIVGETRHTAKDWDHECLTVEWDEGALPPAGERLAATIEIPSDAMALSLAGDVIVVAADDETRHVEVSLDAFAASQRSLMRHLIVGLADPHAGEPAEEVLKAAANENDGAQKSENANQAPPKNPRTRIKLPALKPALMAAFYIAAGLAVFSYVGVMVYANWIQLEVQTAVVSKPMHTIRMPMDGSVREVFIEPANAILEGEALVGIENPELEAEIEAARIAVSAARTALDRAQRRFAIEEQRIADYRVIDRSERDEAEAELAAAKTALSVAQRQYDRFATLRNKGYATVRQMDEAQGDVALAKARLEAAEALMRRQSTLSDVADRRHHNGNEFISDLDLMRVDIADHEASLDQATALLSALLRQRRQLFVRAPFDGTFAELLHPAGAQLMRGDPLAIVEGAGLPLVEAYVNQEEVLQVGLGDEAIVFLPALGRRLKAEITDIDRTSGFVDEQASQYIWRGPDDRSARVMLQLHADAEKGESLDGVEAGTPAVVVFDRRNTREVFARIAQFFGQVG